MKIAIVILNWNGKQLLKKFLPSIITHSKAQATVYVADNASTDDSIQFLKEHYKDVKIIQNNINGGYAKGYNDALQKIDADIYGLLNSDIEVTEGWLRPIIDQFKKEPTTAIIQPKILDFKNKAFFEYAGAAGGYIDQFGYPFCRGRIFNSLEEDKGQFNDLADIFWASGACFFVRASIFHKMNGFDEDYFAHQEEIDLCWRVHHAGYNIQYTGASTVYHVGGATLAHSNPKKTHLNFRNSLFSLVKNIPKGKLFYILSVRMILDGIAAVNFLVTLKPKHFLAILHAHIDFYRHLKTLLNKRKQLSLTHTDYYKIRSIVWDYYVLSRKKFDQLFR